ncbi:NifU family protein [Pseudoxanthobacter sp.]|uniref:NifU family protein n=1 Tax=Pseudoxanthobacter sp. TaxID=1925742 RepID=UPI002FE0C5EB
MFIQTETTPNPQTLKFLPGRPVLSDGVREYRTAGEAASSPLASRLFDVSGVTGVLLGTDFIAVTRDETDWAHLKPAVLGAIMEHYLAGEAVIGDQAHGDDDSEFFDAADEETVGMIKELIEERVRPAVAQDGGDITFKGFRDGVVFLTMRGACSGCPSSTATLRHGIQNLLRHYVPEVEEVRAV